MIAILRRWWRDRQTVSDRWLRDHQRSVMRNTFEGSPWIWPINKVRNEAAIWNRHQLRKRA